MSQAGVVAQLAVRELWISFRLLAALVAFVAAGAVVALLPAPPTPTLERLALGLALATAFSSALAAWTLAGERVSGRAGWLVTRSVSRGTYLLGWFVALAGVAVIGATAAGLLGWMAAAPGARALEPAELGAGIVAVAASACAAIALGLLIGSLARPVIAAGASVACCALAGAAAVLVPGAGWVLPYQVIPRMAEAESVLPDALRAAGACLTAAGVLLVAARLAIERAEL